MTAYWKALSHNGVSFPEPYKPDGLSIRVKGRQVALSPLAEEMAYALAKKKDTPYIQDPTFAANFMKDFVKELPDWCRGARFSDVDFGELFSKVDGEKAAKESMSKEEKKALAAERKARKEELKAKHGKATLDGQEVEIANWMVEPPGLFMGRGAHPMRGKWKPRVLQNDVILNLDRSSAVPPGKWKKIVHDRNSMWMAKWIDKLTRKEKYVWLHESTPIQQTRNQEKYDKAKKVGVNLAKIRSRIQKDLDSKDPRARQVATTCYLIDFLGMRVGDEKDPDEADTVGASTLRVEHVKVKGDQVEFNFIGKDSVSWNKKCRPLPSVLRNLSEFSSGKPPSSEIFHHIDSTHVNKYLSSIVPGVTAKVFRTYHATAVADEALRSSDMTQADDLDKLYHEKEANLKAAIFCNHQRTPPKTWEESRKKKEQKLADARAREKHGSKRVKKLQMELDFYKRTKNYNLNTSLKNYIDPRLVKAWCDQVGLDWAKVYSKSLQRKFSWVAGAVPSEKSRTVKVAASPARRSAV